MATPWFEAPWPCGHNDPVYRGPKMQECAVCGAERCETIDLEIKFSHEASETGPMKFRSKARKLPYARAGVPGYNPATAQAGGWHSFLAWWHLVAKCVKYEVTGKYPL